MILPRLQRTALPALLVLMAISSLASATGVADEPNVPTQIPGHNAILMGTDWYPEQWPESRWETEVRMMEDAHLNVVRLAEFGWSAMEPSRGAF